MSLNPLDPDQKDVALAVGVAYALGKTYDFSGKVASEFRAEMRKGSDEDIDVDLGKPDEVKGEDPRIEIYNSIQEDISSKPENTEQKQGGDDFMVRQHDDPEDLGRQSADARLSQEDMYENLSDVGTAVFDTLVDSYDMALDDAYDAVREAEHKVGDALENAEEDYDTVAEFAEGLEDKIEDELDSLDLDRFTDRAYDRFDTEMGTMERNRERFRNENSEFF